MMFFPISLCLYHEKNHLIIQFFALKKDCNVTVLTAYIFTYPSAKKVLKTCPVRWIGRN